MGEKEDYGRGEIGGSEHGKSGGGLEMSLGVWHKGNGWKTRMTGCIRKWLCEERRQP